MKTLVWNIRISGTPAVIRRCGKCGNDRFVSSGRFRVNANRSRIDVWLIFKCAHCNATWNMEILSRVKAGSICRERYERFLGNDEAMALHYALDEQALRRNGVAVDADGLAFEVYGELPVCNQDARIIIRPDVPLPFSAARVIAHQLGTSQSAVRRFEDSGLLECAGGIRKTRLNADVTFALYAGWDNKR